MAGGIKLVLIATVLLAVLSEVHSNAYEGCKGGNGGVCIAAGTCPKDKKPAKADPKACSAGKECCKEPPSNGKGDSKTCESKGGECAPAKTCGRAPQSPSEDCKKMGHVCCVFVV